MTAKAVQRLRRFLKKETDHEVYLILSAMRGNDNLVERDLKWVTIAMRSYIGLEVGNCSGATLDQLGDATAKTITAIKNLEHGDYDSHYTNHLCRALAIIGKQNLIKFVEKHKYGLTGHSL